MDLARMARNLDLEFDMFLEVLQLFVETSYSDLQGMALAMEKGSSAGVAQFAHSIKGAAANFGLGDILEDAATIESEARRGAVDGVAARAASIRKELDGLAAALQSHN